MSLLLKARVLLLLADGKLFHKFLRNTAFYLTTRNSFIVQDELNLDSVLDQVRGLLPFWMRRMECPLTCY